MAAVGKLQYARLAFFSKPVEDRRLYRLIRQHRMSSVFEVGLGSLSRAVNLVGVCQRYAGGQPVRYGAVDWFEERPADMPRLTLIEAHRTLRSTGAKTQVSPGGPAAVEALANSFPAMDLILISSDCASETLQRPWFYLPRMCHERTLVLRATRSEGEKAVRYEPIPQGALQQYAAAGKLSRAA
ncbi:MAG: hypothetical protein KDA37_17010 [Planctomycetales bacterium]|nr:hypothetical protein [Planctomycetales bacterium]